MILLATAWGLIKRSAWAFLAASAFIILSPTSSFVPLRDLAAEHRMYVPLAAVLAIVVLAIHRALVKAAKTPPQLRLAAAVLLVVIGVALGARTILRNVDYHDEIAMWKQIAEQRPDNMRAQSTYGFMLLGDLRTIDEAIHRLRRVVEYGQGDLAGIGGVNLAKGLIIKGKPNEALRVLDGAEDILHHDPRIDQYRGDAWLALNAPEKAVLHYAKAVKQQPENVDFQFFYGNALLEADRAAEAIAPLKIAASLNPNAPTLISTFGLALHRSGDDVGARRAFQQALGLYREHLPTHLSIAEMSIAQGRLDEAQRHLNFAMAAQKGMPRAQYLYGQWLAKRGDLEGAARRYREALRLDPNYRRATKALAALSAGR